MAFQAKASPFPYLAQKTGSRSAGRSSGGLSHPGQ